MRKSTKHKVLTCDFNCDSSHHTSRTRKTRPINHEGRPSPTFNATNYPCSQEMVIVGAVRCGSGSPLHRGIGGVVFERLSSK